MVIASWTDNEIEFQHIEMIDLASDEPRSLADDIRNIRTAALVSALGCCFCSAAAILSWMMYGRQKQGCYLVHAIVMLVCLLVIGMAVWWSLASVYRVRVGRLPNSRATLALFWLTVIGGGYCSVMCFGVYFTRRHHSDYLVGLSTKPELFSREFGEAREASDVWSTSWKVIAATSMLTVLSAGAFFFMSYVSFTLIVNKYRAIRYGLYLTLASVIVSSWQSIYWYEVARDYDVLVDSKDIIELAKVSLYIAAFAIVIACLTSAVNKLRAHTGYLLFGLLAVWLIVITAPVAALLWRHLRHLQQTERNDGARQTCLTTMHSIHEDDLKDFCSYGGKYLTGKQVCRKEFLVNR